MIWVLILAVLGISLGALYLHGKAGMPGASGWESAGGKVDGSDPRYVAPPPLGSPGSLNPTAVGSPKTGFRPPPAAGGSIASLVVASTGPITATRGGKGHF